MPINQFQMFSGHFYQAEYLEFDETTKRWDTYQPVLFRYKPAEISSQGVSASGKTTTATQNIQGSVYGKREFAISTTTNLRFKKKDKIRIINEDKTYSIKAITEGYDSINAMVNLNFPRKKSNKPHILFLA
ncbi:MAG: hypothetical protein GQ557_02270 [Mycoplasmataceae bacterium]|nr:hypothetical protein [Mycoplasmataceae bacterium]